MFLQVGGDEKGGGANDMIAQNIDTFLYLDTMTIVDSIVLLIVVGITSVGTVSI